MRSDCVEFINLCKKIHSKCLEYKDKFSLSNHTDLVTGKRSASANLHIYFGSDYDSWSISEPDKSMRVDYTSWTGMLSVTENFFVNDNIISDANKKLRSVLNNFENYHGNKKRKLNFNN